MNTLTAHALITEVGRDLKAFRNIAAFTSWSGPKAITATAHKLARIIYHLITTGQAYDETVFAQQEAQNKQRNENRLRQQARKLGFERAQIPMEL